MVNKISTKLEIKEANAELIKAIAQELENEEEKDLEDLLRDSQRPLHERETNQNNTESL